jgi:hypothetical protein
MLTTFGEVKVEGTIFLYIESVKLNPSTSRLTKIDVAGLIFENYQPFPLGGGGGTRGAGKVPSGTNICEGGHPDPS